MGQSRIGIDIELPAAQIRAGVGLLDDLAVPVMGIGHIDCLVGTVGDLDCLNTVISDPVIDAGRQLLDIVGAGFQTGNGDLTGSRCRKRRTGNGFGAGRIGVHTKLPAGKIGAGIGCLLDVQAAGDLLIHRSDGNRMIGRVFVDGHSPLGCTAGAVACGEHGFSHLVGTEGQLAGLCIAVGIGGTDVEHIAGCLIHCLEFGTRQVITVGIFLVDLNKTSLIDDVIDLQMIPCAGAGALGTGIGHVLNGTDLRSAGVTNMDDEVIFTTVGTADIIEIVCAGINGCVGQVTVGIGEDNHVTGDQVRISSGGIGILGNTTSCGIGQVIQASGPAPYGCGGVAAIIHGGSLNGLMNMGGIDAFDVGQVVVDEVAYKGSTHQTICLELGNVRGLAADSRAIRHSFIAVQERAVIVIAYIGQDIGIRVIDVAGNILGNIQITVILQPLDIVAGVLQSTQDRIVVHVLRDSTHIRRNSNAVIICSKHGNSEGILAEHLAGIEVLNGNTVGILDAGVIGKVLFNGSRQFAAEGIKAKLVPFFQSHTVILSGLRPVLFGIFGRLCFSFGCFSGFRSFRRLRCFRTFCGFRNRRLRTTGRFGGRFRHYRFRRGLGALIRGRIDRRHESQHQNKYQQQRQQPLAFCFHVFIVLSKVDIEKGSSPKELKP